MPPAGTPRTAGSRSVCGGRPAPRLASGRLLRCYNGSDQPELYEPSEARNHDDTL